MNYIRNQQGQLSIELMLLIVLALVYINIMILPVASSAIAKGKDISKVSLARSAAETIRNTIEYVSLGVDETELHVQVYLPANTALSCRSTGEILAIANISITHPLCENDSDSDPLRCTYVAKVIDGTVFDCTNFGASGDLPITDVGRNLDIEIQKFGGIVYVDDE